MCPDGWTTEAGCPRTYFVYSDFDTSCSVRGVSVVYAEVEGAETSPGRLLPTGIDIVVHEEVPVTSGDRYSVLMCRSLWAKVFDAPCPVWSSCCCFDVCVVTVVTLLSSWIHSSTGGRASDYVAADC